MELIVISIVTGVFSGIIASLVVWWYLFHFLSPQIEFSPIIAKKPSKDRGCGAYYQFMITNIGHRRAIDISLDILLVIRNYPEQGTDNIYHPNPSRKAILELPSARKKNRVRRRIWINLDDDEFVDKFKKSFFPDKIRQLANDKALSLEELLSIGNDSFVRVVIKVTDSISGSIKVFRSKNYTSEDIREGSFIDFDESKKAPSLLKKTGVQLTQR